MTVDAGGSWPPLNHDAKNTRPQLNWHPTYHHDLGAYVNYIVSQIRGMLPPFGDAGNLLRKRTDADFDTQWAGSRQLRRGGTPGMITVRTSNAAWDWREPDDAKAELAKQGVTQWWHVDTVPPTTEGRVGDVWMVISETPVSVEES